MNAGNYASQSEGMTFSILPQTNILNIQNYFFFPESAIFDNNNSYFYYDYGISTKPSYNMHETHYDIYDPNTVTEYQNNFYNINSYYRPEFNIPLRYNQKRKTNNKKRYYHNNNSNTFKSFIPDTKINISSDQLLNQSENKLFDRSENKLLDQVTNQSSNQEKRVRYKKNNLMKNENNLSDIKGSGIIPYCIKDGIVYFLLQRNCTPLKKKSEGWNDFGGKRENSETVFNIASREFSEETSCLFYLANLMENESNENDKNEYMRIYNILKDNTNLEYDSSTIELLIEYIKKSEKYYADILKSSHNFHNKISASDTIYKCFLLRVPYIPESDIPRAEDLHVYYEERYIRECKWFNIDELMSLPNNQIHKRLMISKIKNKIKYMKDHNEFD